MKEFSFKKYIIKKLVLYLLLYALLVFMGYISKSVGLISICVYIGVFFLLFYIPYYIIKYMLFLKKQNKDELENEINKCLIKSKDWYFTEKYIISLRDFKMIKYSDIIVVDDNFTIFSSPLRHHYYHENTMLLIYTKDNSSYYIHGNYFYDNIDNVKKIIDLKNPRVYFGKYSDYKKIHKEK